MTINGMGQWMNMLGLTISFFLKQKYQEFIKTRWYGGLKYVIRVKITSRGEGEVIMKPYVTVELFEV